MTKNAHSWQFKRRFRHHAFGWRSQPAVKRVREAVSEIKKVARRDPALAAEGAVSFLERVSPAIEHVDSSSGSMGTAVSRAIEALVPIIAGAEVDPRTRDRWLERLYQAHADDQIPYIETLDEHWGDLCASAELASRWADRLLPITRDVLAPDPAARGFFHGTAMCLSALFRAGRHDEILELVTGGRVLWHYQRWAARGLAATGRHDDALRHAEACRGPWASDLDIDRTCEAILRAQGKTEEAYAHYGLRAHRKSTYLAWFRAVLRAYPDKDPGVVLADLVALTPGDEGKWFAAAKDAHLFGVALDLASRAPCDPRTLTRAARDFATREPRFAADAGLLALHWIALGHGYEITGADVYAAYQHTLRAAEELGAAETALERIRQIANRDHAGARFVARILHRELGS